MKSGSLPNPRKRDRRRIEERQIYKGRRMNVSERDERRERSTSFLSRPMNNNEAMHISSIFIRCPPRCPR